MSSKQITFFITEIDLELIQVFLLEKNCLILPRRYKNDERGIASNLKKYQDSGYQFCITKDSYIEDVFFENLKNGEEEYIDVNKSNCVEFSIGGFYPYSNTEFHSGRMYFTTGFFESGEYLKKKEEFTDWASELLKQIKKTFLVKSVKYSNDYFSDSFLHLIKDKNVERSKDGTKFIFLE